MTAQSVKVEGADTLARTLRDVGADLADLAPRAAGDVVLTAARGRAPRVSGRLRSSLTVDTSPGVVSVSSELIYAPIIEWGWPARNIEASHYLTGAAEATEGQWSPLYTEETAAILRNKVKGA